MVALMKLVRPIQYCPARLLLLLLPGQGGGAVARCSQWTGGVPVRASWPRAPSSA